MLIPFVGQAYQMRSKNIDVQNSINCFLVYDKEGKFPNALMPRPRLKLFTTLPTSNSVRGLYAMNDSLYAVGGTKLYSVFPDGSLTERGTLKTTTERVSIVDNGYQLMLTDSLFGYVYQYATVVDGPPTSVFTDITDTDFIPPVTLTYQDGYGIYSVPNTQRVFLTHVNDFTNVDALSFTSASGKPDWVSAYTSSHQELWVIGRDTAEVWYNSGDTDTPFVRRQTLLVQYGTRAPYSLVTTDNNQIFWLSRSEYGGPIVVKVEGYAPSIITTEAVAQAFSKYETVDDAYAFSFQQDSHIFYVITFPSEDATWAYDIATDNWYEWKSEINNPLPSGAPTRQGRWRPNSYARLNGKHYVGDFESGKIYELTFDVEDDNSYTDDGTAMISERTTRHLQNDLKRVTFNGLQIDFEHGIATETGQGSDPKVMYTYSKDNGHTFSEERMRPIGKIGEYLNRARFLRLGQARDWVHRIRMTDPIRWVVLGAVGDVEIEK